MSKFIKLLGLILITISFISCSKKEATQNQDINIYLVAMNGTTLTGKKIGCNDVLVPVVQNVSGNGDLIEEVINNLISAKDTDELKNFVKGPQLLLFQVNVANGIADIYLKGDFQINGACDIPRINEQINETIKQFVYIKRANIYINNQTLISYLDVAKAGFK